MQQLSKVLQLSELGWDVMPQNTDRRESLDYLLSHCAVGQQHELFDERVGLHEVVELHVGGVMGLLVKAELDLGAGQLQGSLVEPVLLELLSQLVQHPYALRQVGSVLWIIDAALSLVIRHGAARSNYALTVLGIQNVGLGVHLPYCRKDQPVDVSP